MSTHEVVSVIDKFVDLVETPPEIGNALRRKRIMCCDSVNVYKVAAQN